MNLLVYQLRERINHPSVDPQAPTNVHDVQISTSLAHGVKLEGLSKFEECEEALEGVQTELAHARSSLGLVQRQIIDETKALEKLRKALRAIREAKRSRKIP